MNILSVQDENIFPPKGMIQLQIYCIIISLFFLLWYCITFSSRIIPSNQYNISQEVQSIRDHHPGENITKTIYKAQASLDLLSFYFCWAGSC